MFDPSQNTRQKKYLMVAMIGYICFLSCSFAFVFYMMAQNQTENIQYLKNAALQHKTTISKQIEGDIQTLNGVAVCLSAIDETSSDQVPHILAQINEGNQFIRMGLADLNGTVDLLDISGTTFQAVDVSGEAFFQQALAGESAFSNTRLDPFGTDYINYYGVPVKNKTGELIGVLCAVNPSKTLVNIVDSPLLNGEGFSSILRADGAFVIRSDRPSMANLQHLSELDGLSDAMFQAILSDMAAGKDKSFTFTLSGIKYLGVINPLEMNDWFIWSVVPQNALQARYVLTAAGTMGVIIVACIMFFFLLHMQRRAMARNQSTLENLAYTDALTSGMNFKKFLLDAAPLQKGSNRPFAVWYCDLKKFKYFNDVFGYQAGDEMLRRMAGLFDQLSVPGSLFCRVSADNFTGLRPYDSPQELEDWFSQLLELLRQAETETANRLYIELCMGFYLADGTETDLSLNDMVNWANMAQKSAKKQPGSQYAFFSQDIREQNFTEAELESQGEQAMIDGQFKLFLQPKVDIQQGNRIAGAEVLSRWIHPEKGLISPNTFIPVFEQNGMIIQLDRYVMELACRWLRDYLDQGRPPISLAINVSRLDMLREDFVEYYTMVKGYYDIPDGLLELEFTESVIIDGDELFHKTVDDLQHNGFVCSMDDFGSGYSSLNLLKNLPIDVVKLDILFFRHSIDMQRERVVISNVLHMAKQLQIRTVAEGVETAENVAFLRDAGCDLVQGFTFFRPMPLEEFDQLLREHGQESMIPLRQAE